MQSERFLRVKSAQVRGFLLVVICSRISCQIEIIKKREKTRKGEKGNGRIKESKKMRRRENNIRGGARAPPSWMSQPP